MMRRCAVMMHARVFSVRFSINQIFPGHFHLPPSPPSTGGPNGGARSYAYLHGTCPVENPRGKIAPLFQLIPVAGASAACHCSSIVARAGGWLGWPIAYLCVFLLFKHFSSLPLQSRECALARLEGSGNYRVAGNNIEVKLNKKTNVPQMVNNKLIQQSVLFAERAALVGIGSMERRFYP